MEEQIYIAALVVTKALLILCGLKAILGFHFPWEKCDCCGKHYNREHEDKIMERIKNQ